MLFRVTNFNSHEITFYIVPDDPTAHPRARVEFEGEITIIEPTEIIPSLIVSGRHFTGLCRFKYSSLKNLKNYKINIYDNETNLLVFNHNVIEDFFIKKRILLPTYFSNKWKISEKFLSQFQYQFEYGKNLNSKETLQEILQNHCESTCIIGDIPIDNILYHLTENIELWIFLDNPDNFWDESLIKINASIDLLNLTVSQMQSLSNPLLKRIAQVGSQETILIKDTQTAFKILSQASVIIPTPHLVIADRKYTSLFEYSDIIIPIKEVNSIRGFLPIEVAMKEILLREDRLFYQKCIDIINLGENAGLL